jgi:hypothetical protein
VVSSFAASGNSKKNRDNEEISEAHRKTSLIAGIFQDKLYHIFNIYSDHKGGVILKRRVMASVVPWRLPIINAGFNHPLRF